jgi:hypothetical protein
LWRTHYQRDRDRVIHSRAFRRLEYKTQVFLNGTGDHLRTRLTHTLEVSAIARNVARALDLNEDLAEKKEDLSDEQHDHEIKLQKDALDKALDDNNKIMDDKIKAEKSVFETKKANLEALYQREFELIQQASQMSSEMFSKQLTDITSQMSNNGYTQPSSLTQGLINNQKNTANINNEGDVSNRARILSILSNGTGKDYGEDASELNAYIKSAYGKPISGEQASVIAKLLGVPGISSVMDIKGNEANKKKLLEALKKAKFHEGGTVSAINGEGLALVKHGEPIFTIEQGKLFKELITNIKPLNNLVKLTRPNIENITNNSSAPVIQFNLNGGTITPDAVNQFNKLRTDITKDVTDAIVKASRGYR